METPFLAIAVTVIEVSLIVTLMISAGPDNSALARETVFAAFMIVCNGVVGLCLVVGALRHHVLRLPETGALVRAAYRNRLQTSLNLALGSTLASIGLTIPAVDARSATQGDRAASADAGRRDADLSTGRATLLQGSVHLSIFSAFLFLAFLP